MVLFIITFKLERCTTCELSFNYMKKGDGLKQIWSLIRGWKKVRGRWERRDKKI